MTEIWLYDEDGDAILDLSDLEPFRYNVEGKPLTRIEYGYNTVKIEWATQDDLDRMRNYFDD